MRKAGHLGHADRAALLCSYNIPVDLAVVCGVGGPAQLRRLELAKLGALKSHPSSSLRDTWSVLIWTHHGLEGSLTTITEVCCIGLLALTHGGCL